MNTVRLLTIKILLGTCLVAQTSTTPSTNPLQSANPLSPTEMTARGIFENAFSAPEPGPEPVFETTIIEMMSRQESELGQRQESDLEPRYDPVFTITQESHEPTDESNSQTHSDPTSVNVDFLTPPAAPSAEAFSDTLKTGLDAIMTTKWTLRDKIIVGVNIAVWGGSYYFLQNGIAKSWRNDFFGTCSENDLQCFIWQYVQSSTRQKIDHIMDYCVVPNVCIAWSFYVISRLMECAERYLPDPKALSALHQEQPLGFRIKSGVMDATALVMGSVLGAIPAVSIYTSYRLGNQPTNYILPYAIPLGVFLMMETIITFKILKDQLIHASLLKTGESGLKSALVERLEEAKHAVFHLPEETLIETYQTFESLPTGFDQLKVLLDLKVPETKETHNKIRFYAKVAASVFACGATAYLAYLSANDSMASLYDTIAGGFNFLGGISPGNQRVLEYFETYAPNPDTAPDDEVLSWFNNCLNYAFTNMKFNDGCPLSLAEVDNITGWDAGSSSSGTGAIPVLCTAEATFGETCAGVVPTLKGFNIPSDIMRTVDNAHGWLVFLFESYQYDAGTTSTDPVPPSEEAVRFGQGMGIISAVFTTALTTFQTGRVVEGLFDLFATTPENAEAGRKSKLFNGINLAFSTFEAAFRTLPVGMVTYFALQGRVPDSLFWPLLVANCLVTMCTFINYFFDHYQKLPAALQTGYALLLYGKAKIFGTPYEAPKALYQKHDGLQKKVDAMITHVARMNGELKILAEALGIQAKETEDASPVETIQIIAEGL
ncbi:MAG: hypothetical protein HEEMFOPI_01157 [Holosporales bacterium]